MVFDLEAKYPKFHDMADDGWSRCGLRTDEGGVLLRFSRARMFAIPCLNCFRQAQPRWNRAVIDAFTEALDKAKGLDIG